MYKNGCEYPEDIQHMDEETTLPLKELNKKLEVLCMIDWDFIIELKIKLKLIHTHIFLRTVIQNLFIFNTFLNTRTLSWLHLLES